ncbi:MAG TPA: flavodoxin family protein [Clostridiales bacterium]|nr:flavodoxin family protein [Clostridiales bacterium]
MKLIICDLESKCFEKIFSDLPDDTMVILYDESIHHCTGCFGCWIKTPGVCVIRDKYGDMGERLSKCEEVIIISRCCYGGYSPFVKNIFDRSISYLHPDFVIKNGEMHHKRRYKNKIKLHVYFYGENITEKENLTAQKLVKANSINMDCNVGRVLFFQSIGEMEGQIL